MGGFSLINRVTRVGPWKYTNRVPLKNSMFYILRHFEACFSFFVRNCYTTFKGQRLLLFFLLYHCCCCIVFFLVSPKLTEIKKVENNQLTRHWSAQICLNKNCILIFEYIQYFTSKATCLLQWWGREKVLI